MAFRRRTTKGHEPPAIAPLSISESRWRGQQLEAARGLVERYCGESAMPPTLVSLDAVIDAWSADGDARPEMNDLVNAIGVAFGHHLARATGLRWVMATDEAGTEL